MTQERRFETRDSIWSLDSLEGERSRRVCDPMRDSGINIQLTPHSSRAYRSWDLTGES
ncbi:hypothetical protein PPACK8108_LOCUS6808 [Phakopsora pachyrhizi]|uniref:Uncharacterized protein n=1 Tax=Phakopsora pachyrhizi TaxID=170000 RepID=A0AAV0ATG7_PHAPC|nr:hypothetical protein PPACK8108_LOCUS6808 [Phakopsora pachyrhizi]